MREDARLLEAARLARERAGGAHVGVLGPIAGEPQRDVGLDRGREVAGAAVEVRPRPVVALPRADPCRGALGQRRIADAEELAQEQVLGIHRDVGLELPLPPTVRVLQGEEVRSRAHQRLAGIARDPRFGDGIGQRFTDAGHSQPYSRANMRGC